MSCTSLTSQLWQLHQPVLLWQLRAGKKVISMQFVLYPSSQQHLGYNERAMSSPCLYPLSLPTATCPVRIYSSPGDAAPCCVSSCSWKRAAHIGCDTGRTQACCCAVQSQKTSVICLHCSCTLHSAGATSRWHSCKGQLWHPQIHHTEFLQNAAMHSLLCDPQK